jgi:hypothetical protein
MEPFAETAARILTSVDSWKHMWMDGYCVDLKVSLSIHEAFNDHFVGSR